MTTEQILAEVDGLTDAGRVRRMVALGRQAETEPETADALASLAAGGFYERRLALLACSGSRDGNLPLRSLSDPSRLLRGLALCLLPILCTDAQVLEALNAAPLPAQTALLGRLVRRGRRGPVDAFLQSLADAEDPALGRLLPFGSPTVVQRYLGAVMPLYGMSDWQRLARRHPDTVLETLTAQAEALNAPDTRLRTQANFVLPTLADVRPAGTLTLVHALLRQASAAQLSLQKLADRLPNEAADLVLASDDKTSLQFGSLTHKLTLERLLALMQRKPDSLSSPAAWMRRLPPETRRAVYAVAGLGWRSAEGVLDYAVAALLPGELRAAEGRRNSGLPALATRYPSRLLYAALLPWDEARALLSPSVGSPDPEQRASALSALIGSVRYNRAHLPDALRLVEAKQNEQDPVRRAMLSALASLPPGRWTAGDLDPLGRIIRAALSAADLSPATASAAEKLATALIPFHPAWAAEWLGTLAKERGQIHFYNLGDRLSDADVERIAPALTPVLASWETRERETVLVGAARSFGRRLRVFPALTKMLERVLAVTPYSHTASQILSVLAAHCPDRLAALVPALIEKDKSVMTLPVVYGYVHRRRQDLITPFLGQTAFPGRFSTGRTRFILPLTGGFQRWTLGQQAIFAQTLDALTRDTARDTPSVFFVINQLAALPAIAPTRLIQLARPAEKPAVRDAALQALARLDGGQGVPTLVEALGDARARIAIYALRTTLLEMPPAAALTLLQAVPREKVTVAKEVVRLLGEIKTPDAYSVLLQIGAEQMHRDVRVALLRALWDHLEQDATWPMLEQAARDPEAAVAGGVVRIPTDRLSPLAQPRLLNLIVTLLAHPDPKVRLDTLARCVDLPLPDPAQTLLPPLLSALSSRLPDESAAAARAVFATYAGAQASAVGAAVGALGTNRRALRTAADALLAALFQQSGRQQATARAVISALAGDPAAVSVRVELAVTGLPWREAASVLAETAASNLLHADALAAGLRQMAVLRSRAAADWDSFESALAASPHDGLRRLAVAALVAGAGTTEGWTPARRERLDAHRQDPAPLVSAAAQFTFPPDDALPEETPSATAP